MARTLIDIGRKRQSAKHGNGAPHVTLDHHIASRDAVESRHSLGEALDALKEADPRGWKTLVLKAFAGLTTAEAAQALGCSERTVKRDWRAAKDWFQLRAAA